MEEKNNLITGIVIGFIIGIIFSVIFLEKNSTEYSSTSYCEETVSEYQDKLKEANEKIVELNSGIEDAKSSAWESCEEMGDALDMLETEHPVEEP